MKITYTAEAEAQLAQHVQFGSTQFGVDIALRTFARVQSFVEQTLGQFPRAGRFVAKRRCYESWVPGTPFIIVYKIDAANDMLVVVAGYHHSQHRDRRRRRNLD